ncbi:MAG TPA: ferric reductase-like transmembrane domain-containing protein [Solirubrobacteraceae bacterium]
MAAVTGPSPLWYLTRGTGAVTLILLTVSLALGVGSVRRVHTERVPRLVFDAVHRSVSLLAVAFLAVHVMTSVFDAFAPIQLIDAFIPFVSAYRPAWLGLGAIASDLLIAVALTSVLRRRLGYEAWRVTHWLAYACWPIALVHGLGTGSDAKATWMLALTASCVLVVLVAVWARIGAGWPEHIGARSSAVVASIAAPIALFVWLPASPLAAGWAKRAGTPSSLLPRSSTRLVSTAAQTSSPVAASQGSSSAPQISSSTPVSGSIRQSELPDGFVHVDLRLARAGQSLSALDIRIQGQPLGGGGVAMTSSVVTLGTPSDPTLYRGVVTGLNGGSIDAHVQTSHDALSLQAQLHIDPNAGAVTGTVTADPASLSAQPPRRDGDGGR